MDGKSTPPPGGADLLRGNIAIPKELHIYFHLQGEAQNDAAHANEISSGNSTVGELTALDTNTREIQTNSPIVPPLSVSRQSADRLLNLLGRASFEEAPRKGDSRELSDSGASFEPSVAVPEPLLEEPPSAKKPEAIPEVKPEVNPEAQPSPRQEQAPGDSQKKSDTEAATEDNLSWAQEVPETIHAFSNPGTVIATLFGVLGPALILSGYLVTCAKRATLQALGFPVESVVQLLSLAIIPIVNYKLNLFVARKNSYLSPFKAALAGGAGASALVVAFICACIEFFGPAQSSGAVESSSALLGISFFASALTTTALIGAIVAAKEFDSLKRNVVTPVLLGALASVLVLGGCQARAFYLRLMERTAIQAKGEQRANALCALRVLDGERLIKMECADNRAGGLAGVFLPIKQSDAYRLYFALSGKPFRGGDDHDFGLMPDEYLGRHLVGTKIDGLSLTRSAMNAEVDSDSLIANVGWTFVFKNSANWANTARGEFALPPGAVVSGLKVWRDGESIPAVFAPSNLRDMPQSNVAGFSCNTALTDLGRDRYLLRCMDLSPENEVKVEVNMVIPLRMVALEDANLILPRFSSTNFSLEGEHTLKLESNHKLLSSLKELTASNQDGKFALAGVIAGDKLTNPLSLSCQRSSSTDPVYVPAGNLRAIREARINLGEIARNHFYKSLFVERKIEAITAKRPGRLIVVIDGSKQTGEHIAAIKESLSKIPAGIPVSVMVASQESASLTEPTKLKDALPLLDKINFVGGQDNLRSLVRASEFAGQTVDGVVVWLHGSQPALNPEIYIMSPFAHKPALYEFAYDAAEGGIEDFFSNHREISQFMPVPRTSDAASDLAYFFSRWQAGRSDYVVKYFATEKPEGKPIAGGLAQSLRTLEEMALFETLAKTKQKVAAAELAVESHLISRYSAAVLYQANEVATVNGAAPILQGATNGTIAPQGVEQMIQGVNTAGTVRVNNLANLEALLNFIANGFELLGLGMGGVMVVNSLITKSGSLTYFNMKLSRTNVLLLGLAIGMAALMVPGVINWFVASARDAALFD